MAQYICSECGYEAELEIHEEPDKCPFCKADTEEIPDLWEESE